MVVVKPFRRSRYRPEDTATVSGHSDSSASSPFVVMPALQPLQQTSKAAPQLAAPDTAQCRLSDPKHRVSAAIQVTSLPEHSLARSCVTKFSFAQLILPAEARVVIFSASQACHSQRMDSCAAGDALALTASNMPVPRAATQQGTDAPEQFRNRNARAIPCQCLPFLDFHFSQESVSADVSPGLLADYLYTAQKSVTHDRGLHRTSLLTCITALRWWAKTQHMARTP